jgi:hypothetical protein
VRDLVIGAACVLGLLTVLWLVSGVFDTSARQPAHALELAQARAEAGQAKADLEKARAELKAAAEALEGERKKVAGLEKKLAERTKAGGATQVPTARAAAGR